MWRLLFCNDFNKNASDPRFFGGLTRSFLWFSEMPESFRAFLEERQVNLQMFQEQLCCFEKARLAGVVRGGGVNAPGDMARLQEKPTKAYELGCGA